METEKKLLSIIIPMKNESEGLKKLFDQLSDLQKKSPIALEFIVIDDGSTDDILEKLKKYQENFPLTILEFSRNFGKEIAMYAGFEHAQGNAAVVIDADLQDPPALILEMIEYWQKGYEIVTAVRSERKSDHFFKRWTANYFYKTINKLSDVYLTPNAGDFRLLDRKVINVFLSLQERVRFTKGIFAWLGFKEKKLYHERPQRTEGKTSWNYSKLLKFSMDGITSFSKTPLEILMYAGAGIMFFSLFYGLYYLIKILFFGIDLPGYPSLLLLILFFGGFQIFAIGLLGQYIGRIFLETKQRPLYILRKKYEKS